MGALLSIFLIVLLQQSAATSAIEITVTDAVTGAPVKNAKLVLMRPTDRGNNLEGFTDEKGYIIFSRVEAGNYGITATAAGYLPEPYRRTPLGNGADTLNVELEPSRQSKLKILY